MKYSEFVQILMPIISGGDTIPQFVRAVFMSVVTDEKSIDAVNNIGDTTAQYYFTGEHSIHKIAVKIRKTYEPELFVSFINNVGEQALQDICNALRPYVPEITPFNTAETCKDIFVEIINSEAQTPRRSRKKKNEIA